MSPVHPRSAGGRSAWRKGKTQEDGEQGKGAGWEGSPPVVVPSSASAGRYVSPAITRKTHVEAAQRQIRWRTCTHARDDLPALKNAL